MSESIVSGQGTKGVPSDQKPANQETKPVWQTPKLEDVSEQVMAQPYIRFT
jgi:hypothetical protein